MSGALQFNTETFSISLRVLPLQPISLKKSFFLVEFNFEGHKSKSRTDIKTKLTLVAEHYKAYTCAKFGSY